MIPRESLWRVLESMERRGMSGRVRSSFQFMYKQDKACVLTSEGPTDGFGCNLGVKQGCPADPLLFSLYLDAQEALLEDASEHIDCPRLAQLSIAILILADDIALFSYFPRGLHLEGFEGCPYG